jgi:hypothetical protein
MPHDKTEGLLAHSPLTILHVDLAEHALPMPLARLFLLATTRFLDQERSGHLLLSPNCECLPYGTGPGPQGDQAYAFLQTPPYGPSTIGLAIGHDASDALEPQREALLNRQWRLDTITGIAVPNPHPEREAAITTHPET